MQVCTIKLIIAETFVFLYRDLSLYPYVQECLGLTKSSLFKGASKAGRKLIATPSLVYCIVCSLLAF